MYDHRNPEHNTWRPSVYKDGKPQVLVEYYPKTVTTVWGIKWKCVVQHFSSTFATDLIERRYWEKA